MERFPKSSLLIQSQFLISQQVSGKIVPSDSEKVQAKKIWQFKTEEEDVTLNITVDSLDISSSKHKTYNNKGEENKFRETISFIVNSFFEIIPLNKISKMGLRYLDDCPLPDDLTKESFLDYYNSFINFSNIEDIKSVNEFGFNITMKKDDLTIIYKEKLLKKNDRYKYDLDFDGQAMNIPVSEYLDKLDSLHDEITSCYHNIIKEPVIKLMNS